MIKKLDLIDERYKLVLKKMSDPEVINNQEKYQKYVQEHIGLKPVVEKYGEYKKIVEQIQEAEEIISSSDDEEMVELAELELEEVKGKDEELLEEMKILLLPKDPNDNKNVIMEIRAGAGGDEAGLFAAELLRLYLRYSESNNWKTEVLSVSETGVGGVKEASLIINGAGAYSRLKYESGIHRVQRVPETESGGRIHTSTATVAVLPEVEDVEVDINPNDLKIDVYRSSGNGGQSVNTTDSAVRITHLPTDTVVTCQDEKSQLKNKTKAMKVLRARLYEVEMKKQNEELSEARKSQIGSGDRSGKIRTYNFPQGRVTEHRIPLTLYKLDAIMNGEIDEIIDSLINMYQEKALKALEE